jgi:hypothetical protein
MAWCPFCRREVNAQPGMYCATCGYQLEPSTRTTQQANALAQLVEPPTEGLPEETPPPGTTPPPQVVYYQHVVYQQPRQPPQRRVQTIEQTGKTWKAQILLSSLLLIAGVVLATVGAQSKGMEAATALGVMAILIGIVWLIFAKLGAWWFHG